MDVKRQFADRVMSLRKERKISQESLAFKSGLDRTYISDIEKGKRNVSIETVHKLALALEVEMKTFFE